MKKLSYIDGLKGIGALMVYFCHFVFAFYYAAYSLSPEAAHTASGLEIAIGKTPLNLLYSGNAAVCLFLVFSGFVLCLSYFSTGDKRRLGKSARRRYLRLMPMILMANIFIFLLMSLGLYRNAETAVLTKSEAWFAGFNQFAPDFLRMLYESLIGCFLQGSNDYNGVLWTIPYLFWGALAVYLTAYLAGGRRLRYLVYGALILILLKVDIYFAGVFLGFAASDFFCTQEKGMELWRRFWVLPLLAFVLGVYLLSYPSIGVDMAGTIYAPLPPAYAVVYHMAGAVGLLLGVLGLPGLQRFFGAEAFRFLGDVSYSLYLLHFPVVATFSCWFFLGRHEKLGYHLTVGLDFLCTTALVLLAALDQRRKDNGKKTHTLDGYLKGSRDPDGAPGAYRAVLRAGELFRRHVLYADLLCAGGNDLSLQAGGDLRSLREEKGEAAAASLFRVQPLSLPVLFCKK